MKLNPPGGAGTRGVHPLGSRTASLESAVGCECLALRQRQDLTPPLVSSERGQGAALQLELPGAGPAEPGLRLLHPPLRRVRRGGGGPPHRRPQSMMGRVAAGRCSGFHRSSFRTLRGIKYFSKVFLVFFLQYLNIFICIYIYIHINIFIYASFVFYVSKTDYVP